MFLCLFARTTFAFSRHPPLPRQGILNLCEAANFCRLWGNVTGDPYLRWKGSSFAIYIGGMLAPAEFHIQGALRQKGHCKVDKGDDRNWGSCVLVRCIQHGLGEYVSVHAINSAVKRTATMAISNAMDVLYLYPGLCPVALYVQYCY